MIYFIEPDTQGNIQHICADPFATIVPLVNRITFSNKPGAPVQPLPTLLLPVGITQAVYDQVMAGGVNNFTYNASTGAVTAKVQTNANKTS